MTDEESKNKDAYSKAVRGAKEEKEEKTADRTSKKGGQLTTQIPDVEWLGVVCLGILADIGGPIGAIPGLIILPGWHILRFHRLPGGPLLVCGGAETVSAGVFPGWTCFIIYIFLTQRFGWLSKLEIISKRRRNA